LALKPGYVDALLNLGNTLVAQRRYDEAISSYHQAIELQPDRADARNNLGGALKMVHRYPEAEVFLKQALNIRPDYAEAHNNLGTVLKEQGRLEEATDCFRRALHYNPAYAEAHNNLGITLKELGRLTEAEQQCREAVTLKPGYFEAYNNLGTILQDSGRLDEAEACLRQALAITPDHADIHYNLGHVAHDSGRLSDAEESYRRAAALNPDSAEAFNNLGNVLKDQGRLLEAESALRQALQLKPDYLEAHSNLLFTGNYRADGNPKLNLELARTYGHLAADRVTARFDTWRCMTPPGRLRVGFVSWGPVPASRGVFSRRLLSQIDPGKMELFAYPTRNLEDDLTARIKRYFAAWRPICGQSDEAAARLIHSDGIHLLIDLAGHTAHNRLPLFSWKPAPIQASWLGYFATTGVAEIDYLIADNLTLPQSLEAHFTETVWRLPETRLCFTAPQVDVPVSALPALKNGYVTFGCFSNLAKVSDEVVALWARVLRTVADSRLLLKAKQL